MIGYQRSILSQQVYDKVEAFNTKLAKYFLRFSYLCAASLFIPVIPLPIFHHFFGSPEPDTWPLPLPASMRIGMTFFTLEIGKTNKKIVKCQSLNSEEKTKQQQRL